MPCLRGRRELSGSVGICGLRVARARVSRVRSCGSSLFLLCVGVTGHNERIDINSGANIDFDTNDREQLAVATERSDCSHISQFRPAQVQSLRIRHYVALAVSSV